MTFIRRLETPAEVRRAIERLLKDPRPDMARAIPERPGRYEIPVAGYWVIYEIIEGKETVIRVTLIEE